MWVCVYDVWVCKSEHKIQFFGPITCSEHKIIFCLWIVYAWLDGGAVDPKQILCRSHQSAAKCNRKLLDSTQYWLPHPLRCQWLCCMLRWLEWKSIRCLYSLIYCNMNGLGRMAGCISHVRSNSIPLFLTLKWIFKHFSLAFSMICCMPALPECRM